MTWKELDPEILKKVAEACDGHGIFPPMVPLELGVPNRLIMDVCEIHKSGHHYKEQISDSEGNPMLAMEGIYGLDLLYRIADDLDLQAALQEAKGKMGRGWQARALQAGILAWCEGAT